MNAWSTSCVARFRRAAVAAFAALAVHAAPAPAQSADSIRASREPLFVPQDALYAGGFVLGTLALGPADRWLADQLQDSTRQANRFLRNSAAGLRTLGGYGSLAVAGGTYLVGRLADRPQLADVGLHTGESIVLALATTEVLKSLAGRARPETDPDDPRNFKPGRGFRNDRYTSFPSGHTTAAFATAASLSTELGRLYPHTRVWVRPLLYGGAGLVGVSRMYHNKHWASDVVAGAAIGSFGGWKVVRYNHTHPGNRLDRLFRAAEVAPGADGGVLLVFRFGTGPAGAPQVAGARPGAVDRDP